MISKSTNARFDFIEVVCVRKTPLLLITKNDVKLVERKLNNRPVRKFNYLTPNQVLQQKIAPIT